jgi:hypothetical protein
LEPIADKKASKRPGAFKKVNTLQTLLIILDGQKLGAGYLTPPAPTALETVRELKKAYDPWVLAQNPLPYPQLLMTPAFVGSLASGQDAIFLDGVDGNLDLSHGAKQPAYVFLP